MTCNNFYSVLCDFMCPVYNQSSKHDNKVKCTYREGGPPEGKFCDVDVSQWSPCTTYKEYNYDRHGPCIFLKLNKVGWLFAVCVNACSACQAADIATPVSCRLPESRGER